MKIAIIHVAETLKGGIASYLEEILPVQVSRFGLENVQILAPSNHLTELPPALGIGVTTFEASGFRLGHVVRMIVAIRRILHTTKVDIIHAHSTYAGIAARIALRGLRRRPKLVYCAHGWAFDRDSSQWKRFCIAQIESLLSHWTDKIICISEHDFNSALSAGIQGDRLVKILNAISVKQTLESDVEWPNGKRRFLFVGRFDRQKGVDLFVEAMRELGDDAFAYIVGSPVVAEERIHNLPRNVKVTGWLPRETVQQYMASAEVVVIPSRWEGFGLTALEAMRANRPVIATRVGGLVELVIEGVTGFLVEPNSKSQLCTAMKRFMDDQVNLSDFGFAANRHFKEHYTSERLNAQLFELYLDVMYRD